MPCSPERLAANRANALRSRGPTTAEGKDRSRRNGLKHGLTGAGVVVPDEDVAEVEARFASFERDLKPKDDVARFLARHAAMLSVRLERCARHEAAALTRAMLRAPEAEASERRAEVDRLVALMVDDPAGAVRQLRGSPEGIDQMLALWADLRDRLTAGPRWFRPHRELAERLAGRKVEDDRPSRLLALALALAGEPVRLDPGGPVAVHAPDRRDAARAEILAIVDAEVAGLRLDRDGLDHEAIALDRAGASGRALFDASREGAQARKYEAAAGRGFFQALKAIERINAAPDEPGPTREPETPCAELGSSWDGPEPSPDAADPAARLAPAPAPAPEPIAGPPPVPKPAPIILERPAAGPPVFHTTEHPPHYARVGG